MRYPFLCLLALAACAPAAGPATTTGATGGTNTQVVSSSEQLSVSTAGQFRIVSADVAAPVHRVWEVLPAVYQELGLVPTADASLRTVRTQGTMLRRFQNEAASRLFDCGRGQFGADIAAQYEVRFNLQTTVQPGAGAETSRLDTGIEAYARNSDGSANALLAVCHTRGRLEEMVAAGVRRKLGT
jgi:hypothetical protein